MAANPDGLLLHENIIYSVFPPHFGMRQYWRDFESLERWARTGFHEAWWRTFLRDTGGTGFWHELYSVRGGFESMYVDIHKPIGFLRFGSVVPAKGALFSARSRLGYGGAAERPPPYQEPGTVSFCEIRQQALPVRRSVYGPRFVRPRCLSEHKWGLIADNCGGPNTIHSFPSHSRCPNARLYAGSAKCHRRSIHRGPWPLAGGGWFVRVYPRPLQQ